MTDPLAPHRATPATREAEPAPFHHLASGEVPGFTDLPVGQERGAPGVGAALGPEDDVASTRRGFGNATARGGAFDTFFAEVVGEAGGTRRGRGDRAHVADLARRTRR
jgi:TPP-dependent pyruvate/acetoin dehydrogenase alpha subunit